MNLNLSSSSFLPSFNNSNYYGVLSWAFRSYYPKIKWNDIIEISQFAYTFYNGGGGGGGGGGGKGGIYSQLSL